jgi:glycine betaine/proline transport system substrate-binding protein
LNANHSDISTKSVRIPLLDWSSQRVISRAIGIHLQQRNYQVSFIEMSEDILWRALSRGRVHFQIEVWQSYEKLLNQFVNKSRIEDLGKHSVTAIEEWWYPLYVEELCPGLPDWTALLECSDIFTEQNSKKGIYHVGPRNSQDADLIRSLKLNFKIERHEDVNEIWAELIAANADKKPILLLNWTHNWTNQRIPGNFLQFPKYQSVCLRDPSWGVNPNMTYDCGNIQNGLIKKAAWSGLSAALPCVYSLIKNMDLNNHMITQANALV